MFVAEVRGRAIKCGNKKSEKKEEGEEEEEKPNRKENIKTINDY